MSVVGEAVAVSYAAYWAAAGIGGLAYGGYRAIKRTFGQDTVTVDDMVQVQARRALMHPFQGMKPFPGRDIAPPRPTSLVYPAPSYKGLQGLPGYMLPPRPDSIVEPVPPPRTKEDCIYDCRHNGEPGVSILDVVEHIGNGGENGAAIRDVIESEIGQVVIEAICDGAIEVYEGTRDLFNK